MIGLWEQALVIDGDGVHRDPVGAMKRRPESGVATYHVACADAALPGGLPSERPAMALRRAEWFVGG